MKQTITFTRTETKIIEIDVVQPLAKATLEMGMNWPKAFGEPSGYRVASHQTTDWKAQKIDPQCECVTQAPKAKARRARR